MERECGTLARREGTVKTDGNAIGEAGDELEPQDAIGSAAEFVEAHLGKEVFHALWLGDGLTKDQTAERLVLAFALLQGIKRQGEIEGMLGAQMVATHSAAMECLRRAMVQGQTFEGRDQNLKHAAKLLAIFTRQVEVLDKHRGKGQQKVTVEYVNVEPGGQAIVGHVETGRGPKRRKRRAASAMSPAIDHAPEVPLEIPDPVVRQRTPQKVPQKVRRGR